MCKISSNKLLVNFKLWLFIFFTIFFSKARSQSNPVLFNFTEVPQSLLLNPGEEINYNWYMGIPGLSNVSIFAGLKDFTASELIPSNGANFNSKLMSLIAKLKYTDHVDVNQQLDFLSGGFRLRNKKYFLSFGVYEELNISAYYPKDYALFLFEGINNIGNKFDGNRLKYRGDMVSVLHVGINKQINKKLTLGGRIKIYSGIIGVKL